MCVHEEPLQKAQDDIHSLLETAATTDCH